MKQISEYGCLISASNLLVPGTGLRLSLNIYDVSVALKGNVKYTAGNGAMGVEFQEIRQGDRPLLEYVMEQVKKRRNRLLRSRSRYRKFGNGCWIVELSSVFPRRAAGQLYHEARADNKVWRGELWTSAAGPLCRSLWSGRGKCALRPGRS